MRKLVLTPILCLGLIAADLKPTVARTAAMKTTNPAAKGKKPQRNKRATKKTRLGPKSKVHRLPKHAWLRSGFEVLVPHTV